MVKYEVSMPALAVLRMSHSTAQVANLLEENSAAPSEVRGGEIVRVTRSGSISARFGGEDHSLVCVGVYDRQGNCIRARICTAAEYAQEKA